MSKSNKLLNNYFRSSAVILFSLLFSIFSCQSNKKQSDVDSKINKSIETKIKPSNRIIDTNICNYSTLDNPKSNKLDMEISYPCDWELKNGESSDVVKKFSKSLNDGSLVEGMLVIVKVPRVPTQAQISALLTDEKLKSYLDEESDKLISSERVKIDGQIVGKIVFETSRNMQGTKIEVKAVEYILFWKDYYIRLQYSTISNTISLAQNLYQENENLFSILAEKTKLIKD